MAANPNRVAEAMALLQSQNTKPGVSGSSNRVEEARALLMSQMQGQNQAPAPVQQEKGPNLLQTLAKPFTTTAATAEAAFGGLKNLAGAGVSSLLGNKDAARDYMQRAEEAASQEYDYGPFGSARAVTTGEDGQELGRAESVKRIIGTGLELGSYAAPVGIGRGAAAALGARRALPLASMAAGGAVAGALGSAGATAREGGSAAEIAGAGLLGAGTGAVLGSVIPGAFRGATRATRGATRMVGEAGKEVLGKSTGAGIGAIESVLQNPQTIKYTRQATDEGIDAVQNKALDAAREGLEQIQNARESTYLAGLEKIKSNTSDLFEIVDNARNSALSALKKFDVDISAESGNKLNALSLEKAGFVRGQDVIERAFNDIMSQTDNTPTALNNLQKRLRRYASQLNGPETREAKALVLQMRDGLVKPMKEKIPGFEKMMQGYAEYSDLIDDVQSALSLGQKASKDTSIRKLMSTMRQNNEFRRQMLDVVSKASGQDIEAMLAGATLSSKTPRGLQGTLGGVVGPTGVSASFLNPAALPYFLTYIALSSPRFVAEALSLLRKVKTLKPNIKGEIVFPVVLRNRILNLITQSSKFLNDGKNEERKQ